MVVVSHAQRSERSADWNVLKNGMMEDGHDIGIKFSKYKFRRATNWRSHLRGVWGPEYIRGGLEGQSPPGTELN